MNLITNNLQLKALIKDLKKYRFFTVDTEFLRNNTYFPFFCLLQLSTSNNAYVIDVLADKIDLTLLKEVFLDPAIVKIFHSCSQDIEILEQAIGVKPKNIFDTQIAAAFCGIGETISYYQLCKKLLNVDIDKTQRITDWSKRPLNDKQIEYAINDVVYLVEIYPKLYSLLEKEGKINWALEHMQKLGKDKNDSLDIDFICKRINFPQIPARAKKIGRIIAVWREYNARDKNLPRRRFLSDQEVINLGIYLSGVGRNSPDTQFFHQHKENIVNFIEDFERQNPEYNFKNRMMNPTQRKLYSLLRNLVRMKSKEHSIAKHLIARNEEIYNLIFSNDMKNFPSMAGWRYEIFGKFAKKIMSK